MSVLDLALVLTVAALAALGAQRRLSGLLVGAGGVLALHPLLVLADLNPWLGLLGGLLTGLGLALLGRHVLQLSRVTNTASAVAGGVGGAALGAAVVLTLVISLPVGRSPLNPNELTYPPQSLPVAVRPVVQRSALVAVGHDVLFAPLLAGRDRLSPERAAVVEALHRWLVIGEPWRRTS